MKRTDKKGFTIVELVIVIAVIAILAAVLIPNISKLVQKANTSADESLVRNLNTALSMDVEKHTTMSEALKAAKDNGGYDLETIELKGKGNKILWDSVNDCFVYLKGTDRVYLPNTQSVKKASEMKDYEYFEIVKEVPAAAEQKYSIYLAGDTNTDAVEVSVGFDAGANKISKVTLTTTETRKVLIYTNGGELVVNAKNATVEHRGDAMSVTITAVAPNSYHEFGTITGNINIANGRLVMETGSKAAAIKVTATKDAINNGSAKISIDNTASNVSIVVPEEVKKAIADSRDDNNKITASEDSIVTDADAITAMDDFAGGLGTKESPYLIATVEQFVKIGKFSDSMNAGKEYSFKLIADIDLRRFNGTFSTFGTLNCVAVGGYFRGSLDGAKSDTENYKLTANDELTMVFVNSTGNAEFSNIDYYYVNTNVWLCPGQTSNTRVLFDNVNLYMVDQTVAINAQSNVGLYTSWVDKNYMTDDWGANNHVTVKNSDVYVNIVGVSGSYNAVFFGGAPYYGGSATVIDSNYYGNYFGNKVNLVLGNTSHRVDYSLVVTNVSNKGTLAATGGTPMIAGGNYGPNTKDDKFGVYTNVSLGTNRYLFDSAMEIELTESGLKIKEAQSTSAEYYVLTLTGGTRIVSQYGENSSYSFSIKIAKADFENGQYQTLFKDGKLATVAQYKELIDATASFDEKDSIKLFGEENAEFWMVEHEGIVYYVFDFHDNGEKYFATKPNKVITSSVVDVNSAMVTVYDSEGLPIAQKPISLK